MGSLIAVRDELMEGDLRALYIAWLASQSMIGSYDEDEEEYEDEEEDDEIISVPAVPPALGTLTAAQQERLREGSEAAKFTSLREGVKSGAFTQIEVYVER